MANMRTEEIIAFARDLRHHYGKSATDIARKFGIMVFFRPGDRVSAHTVKADHYPTIISIYGCESAVGRQILCAHELGHALLHEEGVNRFEGSYETVVNNVEYEANLFAVALLFDEWKFNVPISSMSNYVLKSILDCNLEK